MGSQRVRHDWATFTFPFSHPYMTTGKTIALTIQTFVAKVMSLLLNILSRLVIAFLPRSKHLLISWLQSPSAVILEPKKIKLCNCLHCCLIYLPWNNGTGWHDLHVLNVEFSASFFTLLFHFHQEALWLLFAFCHKGGVIWISKVIDISPGNLDSSLCYIQPFHIMYSVYELNKQGDNIKPWHTPFSILNQSIVLCLVITVASWLAYNFLKLQVRWSDIPISLRIFHSLLWSTQSKALA